MSEKSTWNRTWALGALLTLLALTGCETGPALMPRSMLDQQGASAFAQMRAEMKVSQDARLNAQAQRVAERITRVAATDPKAPAAWEVVVFDDAAVNAFALPGGKIGIYTGLLKLAASDDELACVVGHEVAHVLREHANQRMTAAMAAMAGSVAVDYSVRNQDDTTRALAQTGYQIGAQVGLMLPYSRHHELQADRDGLLLMARAGYDPRAAVTFWEKMSKQGGGKPPEFLSTHPSDGTRIERLKELLPEADRLRALSPYASPAP